MAGGHGTWRVLRAYFSGSIETLSIVQDFFFGEDFLLRRHDYNVNIAGGFGASQLASNYARPRSASHPRHADGLYRHQRRTL